jgi:hypothetical protein
MKLALVTTKPALVTRRWRNKPSHELFDMAEQLEREAARVRRAGDERLRRELERSVEEARKP